MAFSTAFSLTARKPSAPWLRADHRIAVAPLLPAVASASRLGTDGRLRPPYLCDFPRWLDGGRHAAGKDPAQFRIAMLDGAGDNDGGAQRLRNTLLAAMFPPVGRRRCARVPFLFLGGVCHLPAPQSNQARLRR